MAVFPSRQGWAVAPAAGGELRQFATLEEAATAIPFGSRLLVALRTNRVLVERFTLPSGDPAEIDAMVSLQLEKSLPFPLEETASEITILQKGESTSMAAAQVVRSAVIEEEFAPLTSRGVLPDDLILFPVAVASLAPPTDLSISVYSEGAEVVFIISEEGKLAFSQTLAANEFTSWPSEIAQLMFAAEISGLKIQDATIRLEEGLDYLEEPISHAFGRAPQRFVIAPPFRCPPSKLAPASWNAARQSKKRGIQYRRQLAILAGVYVAMILGIVAFLVLLRLRLDQVDKQAKEVRPEIERIQVGQTRWESLAPAVENSRQPLEVILQLYKSRPTDEVLITSYDQSTTDLVVRGEAPAIDQALLFLDTVKSKKELPYNLTNEPPQPMGESKFQFQITGVPAQ